MTKKRPGPELDVSLLEVSVTRELTVFVSDKLHQSVNDIPKVLQNCTTPLQARFWLVLQCDFWNQATWKRANQSERYPRTKDSNLFFYFNLFLFFQHWRIRTIAHNKIENPSVSSLTGTFGICWLVNFFSSKLDYNYNNSPSRSKSQSVYI